MSSSGIEQVFQNIYGENDVKHVLTGKAVSRESRAHIVMESALMIILQEFSLTKDDSSVDLGIYKTYMKELFQRMKLMFLKIILFKTSVYC